MAAAALLVAGCGSVEQGAETRPAGDSVLGAAQLRESALAVDFTRHVRPILEGRCLYCHDREERSGGFVLVTREEALKPGPRGPRIVPGNAAASPLLVFISTGNHAMSMPAVGMKVPDAEVDILRRWIDAGAPWPAGEPLRARD
ncbi:MAG: hypothetical protein HKO57_05475 [Akkermansiaceae bacterium]|nr:hypothetical protein [Akkermansiaceae bacterium]